MCFRRSDWSGCRHRSSLSDCLCHRCTYLLTQEQTRGHLRRSKARVDFLEGHKNCWGGGPGVFTWYHTRIGSMNFNFQGPFGGTPGAPKSKIKIRAHFVVLPINPQHNNILNIAWTIEQLNLKLKKIGMGAQKFMGSRNYLGAMTQARHCVTLRWPLEQTEVPTFTLHFKCLYSACREHLLILEWAYVLGS